MGSSATAIDENGRFTNRSARLFGLPVSFLVKLTLASVDDVGIASRAFCFSDVEVRSFEESAVLIFLEESSLLGG